MAKKDYSTVGQREGPGKKYTQAYLRQAEYLLSVAGLPMHMVPKALDIEDRTFYAWRKTHPEFDRACREARANKEIALLEHQLYLLAMGRCKTVKHVFRRHPTTGRKSWHETTETYHAPNVEALIRMLAQRDPEHWTQATSVQVDLGEELIRLLDARANNVRALAQDTRPPLNVTPKATQELVEDKSQVDGQVESRDKAPLEAQRVPQGENKTAYYDLAPSQPASGSTAKWGYKADGSPRKVLGRPRKRHNVDDSPDNDPDNE